MLTPGRRRRARSGEPAKTSRTPALKIRHLAAQLEPQERKARQRLVLHRRHHAGNGVVKRRFSVEVGLPEPLQEFEVVLPPALIKTFAKPVSAVAARRTAVTFFFAAHRRRSQDRADGLARRVKNQSVPEIPGNGFI